MDMKNVAWERGERMMAKFWCLIAIWSVTCSCRFTYIRIGAASPPFILHHTACVTIGALKLIITPHILRLYHIGRLWVCYRLSCLLSQPWYNLFSCGNIKNTYAVKVIENISLESVKVAVASLDEVTINWSIAVAITQSHLPGEHKSSRNKC